MAPHNAHKSWRAWLLLGGILTATTSWAEFDLNSAQRAVRMQQFNLAYSLYREAAEAGSVEAQYQLSVLYAQGRGIRQNERQSRQWLTQAAEAEHPAAQYLLAQQLLGDEPERARALIKASAEQGYRAAQSQLQRLGSEAQVQLEPSKVEWFGAARKGDVETLKTLLQQSEGAILHSTDNAGRTALFTAVEAAKINVVRWLLEQGVDVNFTDSFGLSAASTAIQANRPQTLQLLLESGASRQQTLRNGDNLLHYALRMGRDVMAERLIQAGVNINHRNADNWTPLDLAESQNTPRALAALNQRNAEYGPNWRAGRSPQDVQTVANRMAEADAGHMTPEAKAIVNSNVALLRELIERNPQRLHSTLPDNTHLLILAVKHNHPETVQTLLDLGIVIDQPAIGGTTALHVASRRGLNDMVTLLLAEGANPQTRNVAEKDAILIALEEQQERVAQTLLDALLGAHNTARRADIQSQRVPVDDYLLAATRNNMGNALQRLLPYTENQGAVDNQQRNALWFAAHQGDASLIDKLLSAGVSARQTDKHGRTPFFMAVNSDCLPCARRLLPHSDINQITNTGNTALILAAGRGNAEITAWLLAQGADLEVRNERGNTAVMDAVTANHRQVVRLLLDARANVTRKNRNGVSALDMARNVSPEMFELVRSATIMGIF